MPNSSRLDRGFLEACSRLWKTHRGFIEACSRLSETIGFYGAELIEGRSRLSKTIVFLMENASRLHRGLLEALRNHLFFMQQNSSRLARAFLSVSMSLSNTILVSSRRLLACFNLSLRRLPQSNFVNFFREYFAVDEANCTGEFLCEFFCVFFL